jgi:hypothetical protein
LREERKRDWGKLKTSFKYKSGIAADLLDICLWVEVDLRRDVWAADVSL